VQVDQVDRERVIAQLRAHAAGGAIGSAQLQARTELAMRAETRDELVSALGGLDAAPRPRAQPVGEAELMFASPPRRRRSFLERQILICGGLLAFWLIVCAATGSSAIWYLLTIIGSLVGFGLRIARGDRPRGSLGRHT
jgi:hypothetical protein